MEEDFGMRALYRRAAGVDVHRMLHVVTVPLEQPDGSMQRLMRQFGGFRRDCRGLAAWLAELRIELVVMESTGIYWKRGHAHLENAAINVWAHELLQTIPRIDQIAVALILIEIGDGIARFGRARSLGCWARLICVMLSRRQARAGENVPRTSRPGLAACRWRAA